MTTSPRLSDKIGQFTTIPNSVIKIWKELGREAFSLFVYLRYRSNERDESFPSYTTIHEDTGMRRGDIATGLKILLDHGLVEKHRRFGNSTIYILKLPSISPPVGLMDNNNTPLVHLSDCISPPVGLSLVHLSDTNKIPLTRSKESDSGGEPAAPAFITEIEAERVFTEITGMITFPSSSRSNDIDRICKLWRKYGSETIATCKPYYDTWINVRHYSRVNTSWLDWVVAEQIPQLKKNGTAPSKPDPSPILCQRGAELRQAAINSSGPEYARNMLIYESHSRTCPDCNPQPSGIPTGTVAVGIDNLVEKWRPK